jgi:hypothetical protein
MLVLTVAGMWLSLRVFGGIITGKFDVLFLRFDRDKGEGVFALWMGAGAVVCLALFFVALRLYLGPLGF